MQDENGIQRIKNAIERIDGLDDLAELDLFAEELPERLNSIRPATLGTASCLGTFTGCLGSASSVSTLSCA